MRMRYENLGDFPHLNEALLYLILCALPTIK